MVFASLELLLIYAFKYYTIKCFPKAMLEDQIVHIVSNTLVVIPFKSLDEVSPRQKMELPLMSQNDEMLPKRKPRSDRSYIRLDVDESPQKEDPQKEEFELTRHRPKFQELNGSEDTLNKKHKRSRSEADAIREDVQEPDMKRIHSIITHGHHSYTSFDTAVEHELKELAKEDFATSPDITSIRKVMKSKPKTYFLCLTLDIDKVVAFVEREFNKERLKVKIQSFWWEDPKQCLTIENIKEEIIDNNKEIKLEDQDIEEVFTSVIEENLINKDLFHPRRTRAEYFLLMMFMGMVNFALFFFEVSKNGWISNYHYSLIALSSYIIGLLFLGKT